MNWSGFLLYLFAVCSLLSITASVDRGNFKKCQDSSFCKRNRARNREDVQYVVDPDSLVIEDSSCKMDLVAKGAGATLLAEIFALKDNMFRVKINEKNPIRPRYQVQGSLVGEPELLGCKVQRSSEGVHITASSAEALVSFDPFSVSFLVNGEIGVMLNSQNLLNVEHYRDKKIPPPADPPTEPKEDKEEDEDGDNDNDEGDDEDNDEDDDDEEEEEIQIKPTAVDYDGDEDEPGMWEEKFKTHHDSKPYGPSSLSVDISFPGVEHVYGIPEHADSLVLKQTKDTDPYRLYNLDVFEYELNNPMALYGSIPFMLAHNWSKTVGVFWHNAAEMWVDIASSTADQNIIGKLISIFRSSDEVPQIDTHWFAESGIIDLFIILGPRPHDVFRQYSSLTGKPAFPPMFALSYHQCRWNYNDQEDVLNVNKKFDEHNIPYDVLWLDIEHTDGKRYFTWDSGKFPSPEEMQNNLSITGRKMVTIIDPHIKRDSNYHIHKDAQANDVYVKKADGSEYEGWCWPGTSSWVDFFNPDVRRWWAEQFAVDKYKGSTLDLFTWNDMNEPSVFNGPEITMHKDARHFGGWEHRDVHNMYGLLQHQASYEGHLHRSNGAQRPFVLSRAFFAGSQRYGAIWTGDNTATWDQLRAALPMLLSISVAGLPFVGADVGGFFKDPEPDLLVRWYQAGVFYPFFRAHAHLDSKRREPYLLEPDKMDIVREAVRLRYQLLPFWYTTFYHSHVTGMPVLRPLWMEFSRDKNVYAMEDQAMIGSSLMVRPVVDQHATNAQFYLPGNNLLWYDLTDLTEYSGSRRHSISTPLSKIPVFVRGGSIIPTKQRIRRSSALTHNDPYTLIVALDKDGEAKGQLFIDDGVSFKYQDGHFLLRDFHFSGGRLTSSSAESSGSFSTKSWLERVIITGYPSKPSSVTITFEKQTLELRHSYNSYGDALRVLTIGKPAVNMATDFVIAIS